MAALIKKAPALLATAKEVAVPKLNTFWRYAKVGDSDMRGNIFCLVVQVELAPPSPGDIPVAISDLSTKIANLQKQSFRGWTVSNSRPCCHIAHDVVPGQPDCPQHSGGR